MLNWKWIFSLSANSAAIFVWIFMEHASFHWIPRGCESAPIWSLLQHESNYMINRSVKNMTFLNSRNFQYVDLCFK